MNAKTFAPGSRPGLDAAETALCEDMAGYLAGRIDSFDALYDALAQRLRSYLLALCRDASVADDLLQDTFLQVHRARHTYQPGRPVTPWAFAIARHVFLMHQRRTARRLRLGTELSAQAIHERSSHSNAAGATVDGVVVRRALSRVPQAQRNAVVLHHVYGWSFADIAATLGIQVNAARLRAFRGLKRMRDIVGAPSR